MSKENRILVVEDNDFVRMQIVRFLSDAGYDVVETEDGQKALECVNDNIGLAIVDVRMEPLDGFEFIKKVKGLELNLSYILVTGDQNPDLLSEAGMLGVSAVLMKPVEKDRLLKTVERTIDAIKRAS